MHTHTHIKNIYIYIYIYILFKKSKSYIKIFKTLLHVLIARSYSGSILCSLLKLYFKTFNELLRYVNFSAVAACRVFVCESYTVKNEPGYGCASYAVQRVTHAAQHKMHSHNQAHS